MVQVALLPPVSTPDLGQSSLPPLDDPNSSDIPVLPCLDISLNEQSADQHLTPGEGLTEVAEVTEDTGGDETDSEYSIGANLSLDPSTYCKRQPKPHDRRCSYCGTA